MDISPRAWRVEGSRSRRATVELRPSAPMTHGASTRCPSSRTTPRTGSSTVPVPTRSTTAVPNLMSAPASRAVSTSAASSATRRMETVRSCWPTGVKPPATAWPSTRQLYRTGRRWWAARSRSPAPSRSSRCQRVGEQLVGGDGVARELCAVDEREPVGRLAPAPWRPWPRRTGRRRRRRRTGRPARPVRPALSWVIPRFRCRTTTVPTPRGRAVEGDSSGSPPAVLQPSVRGADPGEDLVSPRGAASAPRRASPDGPAALPTTAARPPGARAAGRP